MYGYAGKILHVDLTNAKIKIEELKPELAKNYVGGKCLGAKLLYDSTPNEFNPLAPENVLVFSAGPLTGVAPLAPKISLVTRSPLTGAITDSTIGGYLGPELKFAGFDVLAIFGKSPSPVYLWINDDAAEIRKAEHLWGLETHETEDTLKQELGKKVRVASIGPAGENLVKFANVTSDKYRHAGRGGAGAVMGSKNLKAIAVNGTKHIDIANSDELYSASEELLAKLKKEGGDFVKFGTMWLMDPMNDFGMLPTKNFQLTQFDDVKKINGEYMKTNIVKKDYSCYLCPLHCGKYSVISWGKFKGTNVVGPEYETTVLLGSNCGVSDIEAIAYANLLCDKLGLDTMSTGGVLAFAMECFERGILNEKDTDGVKLAFGNADAIITFIKKIAYREGLGNILAEGVKRASQQIGKGAEKYALHIKGLEMPGYDPRGAVGMALAYATADRGACHLRAWTVYEEVMGNLDRYSFEGKAELVAARQDRKAVIDSIGICEMWGLLPQHVRLLSAVTGWKVKAVYNAKYTSLIQDLAIVDGNGEILIGARAYTLTRLFNCRKARLTMDDDTLPVRFFTEEVPYGPTKGRLIDKTKFYALLKEFYCIRGWDENGVPKKDRLLELSMKEYIE